MSDKCVLKVNNLINQAGLGSVVTRGKGPLGKFLVLVMVQSLCFLFVYENSFLVYKISSVLTKSLSMEF